MFEPQEDPRVFGLPLGVDFAQALIAGLMTFTADMAPQDVARIEIFVNTTRMQRRLRDIFDRGPAMLLPRIRLITDLAQDPIATDAVQCVSPLRRRLEISNFVSKLLDQEPDLAPRAALFDLADSLADLMDEMRSEGVTPEDIAKLDVSDQSGHWDRALRFLNIITPFFSDAETIPDNEARQRQVIETLIARWEDTPPAHPIIVAGSTGSRGATGLLMKAVARLPLGAVVLPGFDTDLPGEVWDVLDSKTEDHPQYRFKALLSQLHITQVQVRQWHDTQPPNPARNRLISLSLRPAPVTDQWLKERPEPDQIAPAAQGLTLVEASSPRAEAEAIALRLRQAAEDGITAALITPDRNLTRQVTAALDRWDLVPDDSAGTPLQLSAPGRFLRHVSDLRLRPVTGEALLTLLKHPLCHSSAQDRGNHLRFARELELHLRRHGPPFPTAQTLSDWGDRQTSDEKSAWAMWLSSAVEQVQLAKKQSLKSHIEEVLQIAEHFARGETPEGSGGLWDKAPGRAALKVCDVILRDADAAGELTALEFAGLFNRQLSKEPVRDRDTGHPNILILGTLESRVHSADLVILGGMNDGIWPEAPAPDPWLNRKMRAEAGLLSPERRIGLSAHDYQQAVAGKEVWITRAKRSSDAETVPSRWVNRLVNLLRGLGDEGATALATIQAEGDRWLAMAAALSAPPLQVAAAPRPSPRPPLAARPKDLSVTRIKTLIRDPYAIYAEKVLRLRPLDPLVPEANAPLRGTIIHAIFEEFIAAKPDASDPLALDHLMEIAQRHFIADCPWPTIRTQWLIRMEEIAPLFLKTEAMRQQKGTLAALEAIGALTIPAFEITITCKADRIDLSETGNALIYDYKTGAVPSEKQQLKYDKQLLVEAVMVARGSFKDLGERYVEEASFLGINTDMKIVPAPLKKTTIDEIYAGLETLFSHWAEISTGYSARMAMFQKDDVSPYDHLSRFGEWTMADQAKPEDLS